MPTYLQWDNNNSMFFESIVIQSKLLRYLYWQEIKIKNFNRKESQADMMKNNNRNKEVKLI